MLNGQYRKYFVKNDCKYSYEDNVYGNEYLHDYYVDNPEKYGAFYLIDKLTELREYSEENDNIVSHDVLDTLYYVNGEFQTLSTTLIVEVGNNLSKYGYIDVQSPFMDTEMDSMTQFIDLEIEQRKQTISSQIEEIRTQANALRETYNQLNMSFNNAMANYNQQSIPIGETTNNLFAKCQHPKGEDRCDREKYFFANKKSESKLRKSSKIDPDSIVWGLLMPTKDDAKIKDGFFYQKYDNDKAKYDRFIFEGGTEDCKFDDNTPLANKISKIEVWMSQPTSAIAYYDPDTMECELDESSMDYGFCNPGVLAACQSIRG